MAIGACMWSGVLTLTESRFLAFLVEQDAPILVMVILPVELLDRPEPAGVHLGDAHDLHVGMAGNAPQIGRPHAADAECRHGGRARLGGWDIRLRTNSGA